MNIFNYFIQKHFIWFELLQNLMIIEWSRKCMRSTQKFAILCWNCQIWANFNTFEIILGVNFALYYVGFSIVVGYFTLYVIWFCNVQVIQIKKKNINDQGQQLVWTESVKLILFLFVVHHMWQRQWNYLNFYIFIYLFLHWLIWLNSNYKWFLLLK